MAITCGTLVACGGGSDSSAPAVSTPVQVATFTPQADVLQATAKPRVVSWTVDSPRAASATIGALGGSLVATAADGTRFTLAIPPGALALDVPITMTPIASFTGGRWTQAAGVQLLPDGLAFLKPAVLQFEPSFSAPIEQQAILGFAGETSGEQFVTFADPASATPRALLMHFSARAYVQIDAEGLVDAQTSFPSSPALRMENELATAEELARQEQLLNAANNAAPDLGVLYARNAQGYWNQVLKNKIAAAAAVDSCDGWRDAMQDALNLGRQGELLGLAVGSPLSPLLGTGDDMAAIPGSGQFIRQTVPFGGDMNKALAFACVRQASVDCAASRDLRVAETVLGAQRQQQLLGLADPVFDAQYLRLDDRVAACQSFRVELDSTLDVSGLAGASAVHTKVSARALQSVSAEQAVSPAVLLQNTSLVVDGTGCGTVTNMQTGDGALAALFSFDVAAAQGGRLARGRLELNVADTAESWVVSGCDIGASRFGPQAVWSNAFRLVNADKLIDGSYRFEAVPSALDGWELPPSGAVLMRKIFNRALGGVTENTTLQVVHTPQGITENATPPPGP
jgi:hypothetical protein